jgi:hypothetical protein
LVLSPLDIEKVMIGDWKEAIAVAWLVKQALMEADKKKNWPCHLPEVAATEEQIQEAETVLGCPLDPRYREFLGYANGWPGFWHTADLFGTADFIGGPRKENAEFAIGMLDDAVLEKSKISRGDLLPISATKFDRDLFVIVRKGSTEAGVVIWFAGEEIERFATFDDYFLAMVDYNRLALQRFNAANTEGN